MAIAAATTSGPPRVPICITGYSPDATMSGTSLIHSVSWSSHSGTGRLTATAVEAASPAMQAAAITCGCANSSRYRLVIVALRRSCEWRAPYS